METALTNVSDSVEEDEKVHSSASIETPVVHASKIVNKDMQTIAGRLWADQVQDETDEEVDSHQNNSAAKYLEKDQTLTEDSSGFTVVLSKSQKKTQKKNKSKTANTEAGRVTRSRAGLTS